MDRESTSFWSDIKKYEDTLAKDPRSYCFAPLSELYRKLGLLDDAISTAKRGVEVHPEYIGGYMALGRAYFDKGMRLEARESLEKVAKATPENLLAQKLLSQIYQEEGNIIAAAHALRTLMAFNPEDTECRFALEALEGSLVARETAAPEEHPAVSSIEVATSLAVTEDVPPASEWADTLLATAAEATPEGEEEGGKAFTFEEWEETPEAEVTDAVSAYAPLPTMTLAALFASQGLRDKALDVYNQILEQEPDNEEAKERIEALRLSVVEARGLEAEVPDTTPGLTREAVILETLEKWLYSIRRGRECRSGKF